MKVPEDKDITNYKLPSRERTVRIEVGGEDEVYTFRLRRPSLKDRNAFLERWGLVKATSKEEADKRVKEMGEAETRSFLKDLIRLVVIKATYKPARGEEQTMDLKPSTVDDTLDNCDTAVLESLLGECIKHIQPSDEDIYFRNPSGAQRETPPPHPPV